MANEGSKSTFLNSPVPLYPAFKVSKSVAILTCDLLNWIEQNKNSAAKQAFRGDDFIPKMDITGFIKQT